MDSLTQIVLGAAVGEAVLGKKLGNKALLWGAIAGTIPDLDVLAGSFQDLVQELYYHRSITHSILFALVISPLFAWILRKIFRKSEVNFKEWTWFFFLAFITHVALDCFTTWGTKIFYPFSDYPVSFNSIFVIDPLYTLPFLICVIGVMFYQRTDSRRKKWNTAGLIISTSYLLLTVVFKLMADKVFLRNFESQNISYLQYSTKPTIFNSIMWSATAEVDSGYYIGYYSLLDTDKNIRFNYFPKNHALLKDYLPDKKLEKLIRITEGYYIVKPTENGVKICDLRFGQPDGFAEAQLDFTFEYLISGEKGNLQMVQSENDFSGARELFSKLGKRILGN